MGSLDSTLQCDLRAEIREDFEIICEDSGELDDLAGRNCYHNEEEAAVITNVIKMFEVRACVQWPRFLRVR